MRAPRRVPIPMRFEISYESEYRYSRPVAGNFNRLRMKPTSGDLQRLEHFDVRIEPVQLIHRYVDLFGNDVVELLVATRHQRLQMEIDALVATTQPIPAPQAPRAALRSDRYRAMAGPYIYHPEPEIPDLGALARDLAGDSPAETTALVMTGLRERFSYDAAATTVTSTVTDFLAARGGVCQDFAHLALMLLREQDIAARYVSGYFYTVREDAGPDAASAEVQTHAWVEALLPVSGDGEPVWFAIDPTNGILAGEHHVKIGHGRMYSDVPPIEGTFAGDAETEIDAHVTMTRVDSGPLA